MREKKEARSVQMQLSHLSLEGISRYNLKLKCYVFQFICFFILALQHMIDFLNIFVGFASF